MNGKNCTTCRFGYQAEEYYSHGGMKWCCMLETGGERQRYALGKARYEPRSCIRREGEEARLVATNHEKYFGTPERAAMIDTNHLFDPYDDYTGKVEVLFGGKRVFEFESQADYLAWLESEADHE